MLWEFLFRQLLHARKGKSRPPTYWELWYRWFLHARKWKSGPPMLSVWNLKPNSIFGRSCDLYLNYVMTKLLPNRDVPMKLPNSNSCKKEYFFVPLYCSWLAWNKDLGCLWFKSSNKSSFGLRTDKVVFNFLGDNISQKRRRSQIWNANFGVQVIQPILC